MSVNFISSSSLSHGSYPDDKVRHHDIIEQAQGARVFKQVSRKMARDRIARTVECGKNCKCCSTIAKSEVIPSCFTRDVFFPIRTSNQSYNCITSSVVYVIVCSKCQICYVGQTKRRLKDRVLEHLRSIAKNESGSYLVKHFNLQGHSVNDFTVHIAEKCNGNLFDAELFWIKLLNSAFPFGLNDNIKGFGNISEIDDLFKKKCPYFLSPIPGKKHKARHRRASKKTQ